VGRNADLRAGIRLKEKALCLFEECVTGEAGSCIEAAVYRATDTKLNRDVAIKVFPDFFISNLDRVARFRREAQVLASLNHPNIGAIYGIEDRAIVMGSSKVRASAARCLSIRR
jgi:hypothetical protein